MPQSRVGEVGAGAFQPAAADRGADRLGLLLEQGVQEPYGDVVMGGYRRRTQIRVGQVVRDTARSRLLIDTAA